MARRTGSIKRSLATALVIALCGLHVLASPTPAGAATTGVARVDASFGDGFKRYAISALDDEATAVAVLPGGGVVVVGRTGFDPYAQGTSSTDIVVARFTPSGRLDAAFGANGTVVIGQPGQWDRADAVAVQGDGRILLAGSVDDRPSVLRLTASGELDPTFQGGIVPVYLPQHSHLTALALQPDGRILFTGSALAVGRLLDDGALDPTFGNGGVTLPVTNGDGAPSSRYRAIALQPDGRILVGGSTDGSAFGGPVEVAAVARYTAAGVPDASFGERGLVTTNLDTSIVDRGATINGLALQPDGRIVAVGRAYEWATPTRPDRTSSTDVALFRYLPDGRLDASFAADGKVITRLAAETDPEAQPPPTSIPSPEPWRLVPPTAGGVAQAVSVGPGGALLVVGTTYAPQPRPSVLRYSASGVLDTTFGRDGAFVVDLGGPAGRASAMGVQPDGRVVVVGDSRDGDVLPGVHSDLLVGRVIPDTGVGTVWTWGWNGSGQLGDGTTTDRHAPTQVQGLRGVVAVSAGNYHTLALRGDGTVWAWGMNLVGQLGDGTARDRLRPVPVPGLTGVVAVAAGGLHSMALRGDGTVWTWGWNGVGQLGDGTTATRVSPAPVPGVAGVISIAAGLYHSLAIREDGRSAAWGYNAVGQLGDSTTVDRPSPIWLGAIVPDSAHHRLSAGGLHSLAVTHSGALEAWGWNGLAQLGSGAGVAPDRSIRVGSMGNAPAAGWYHSLLLEATGSVRAAGWNGYGQVGHGAGDSRPWAPVPGLTDVVGVGAGALHSLAVTREGRLYAWGWNVLGQLGTGTTVDARSPRAVASLANVVAATGGFVHSVAITG